MRSDPDWYDHDEPPEEDEGEAWEYWQQRAMAAETALHLIRQLEPGTQEWVDGAQIDAVSLLGDIFRIARAACDTHSRPDNEPADKPASERVEEPK